MDEKRFMKAVRYSSYGGPEVFKYEDAPIPVIGKDDVLVKVAGTTFNPADTTLRSGNVKDYISLEFPFIPCYDVAGVIEEVGENVSDFVIGDKVFGYIDLSRNGAAAEYVSCKAEYLALAPKTIVDESGDKIY